MVFVHTYISMFTTLLLTFSLSPPVSIQSWKKRWFVLTLLNPMDPSSLDLSYYSEADRRDKKGTVNLQEIRAVNPIYTKSKGNVFSVETEDRKFLLRAPDEQQKAVWVAKLLEGCSKGKAVLFTGILFSYSKSACVSGVYICVFGTRTFQRRQNIARHRCV